MWVYGIYGRFTKRFVNHLIFFGGVDNEENLGAPQANSCSGSNTGWCAGWSLSARSMGSPPVAATESFLIHVRYAKMPSPHGAGVFYLVQ